MSTQAAFGWMGPIPVEIMGMNRTGSAAAVGDMLMMDWRRTDGDSTSNSVGIAASGIANFILPASTQASDFSATGIFGIVQQAAGNDVACKVRLIGQCDAVKVAGTVILATDAAYGPANATSAVTKQVLQAAPQTNAAFPVKNVFIPLTARTGAGTTDGWFDGIRGFGFVLV